jgi:hypothetical protein
MFLIIGRFWNDLPWLKASLEHIEYWNADKVIICEGNWDKKWPARSTDYTREYLEEYCKNGEKILISNLRDDDNYRVNQANTSNKAMKLAGAGAGDWVMVVDCDHFYFKKDIDRYRSRMLEHPILTTRNFYDDTKSYYTHTEKNGSKLPYLVLAGSTWIPTNHLAINGNMYCDTKVKFEPADIIAYHYVGLRNKKRLEDKYSIGDRQSPKEWKGGKLLNNMQDYFGPHPEFVIPVLKEKGYEV